MFSVVSVCQSVHRGCPLDLFKPVHFGIPLTQAPLTCSNVFTCCPFIYLQAGGWPSIEKKAFLLQLKMPAFVETIHLSKTETWILQGN